MELRRLRILREVHLRGGVIAASEALHVTPSAVSQQIGVLAKEVGAPLLEKAGRGVVLTPSALALLAHVEHIENSVERGVAAAQAATEEVNGTIRIGSFPSVARFIITPSIAALSAEHPDLRIGVYEREDRESTIDLRSGALDIAMRQEYLNAPTPIPDDMVAVDIAREPVYLMGSAACPIPPGGLTDMAGARWIMSHDYRPCGICSYTLTRSHGFEPDVQHEALDFDLMADLVAAGQGNAIVAALAFAGRSSASSEGIHRVAIPSAERRVYALMRRIDLTADADPVAMQRPAVQALIAAMRDEAERVLCRIEPGSRVYRDAGGAVHVEHFAEIEGARAGAAHVDRVGEAHLLRTQPPVISA